MKSKKIYIIFRKTISNEKRKRSKIETPALYRSIFPLSKISIPEGEIIFRKAVSKENKKRKNTFSKSKFGGKGGGV